jgi:lactoylglutathione lyase
MATQIEHVAVWTHDLERLKTFYEKYFHATASKKYVNIGKQFESYFLTFGSGARLELMCMPTIPASRDDALVQFTGYIHLAFSMGAAEQLDALTAQLAQDGYRVVSMPRRTGDGYYESVVLDPDGNRIEISV